MDCEPMDSDPAPGELDFAAGRAEPVILARVRGGDLLASLEKLARQSGIDAALVRAWGRLDRATLGFWLERARTLRTWALAEPVQIAACHGLIIRNRTDFETDISLSVADAAGKTYSGRLGAGCRPALVHVALTPLEADGITFDGVDPGTGGPILGFPRG